MNPYNDTNRGGKWQGCGCCKKHTIKFRRAARKRARQGAKKRIEIDRKDFAL